MSVGLFTAEGNHMHRQISYRQWIFRWGLLQPNKTAKVVRNSFVWEGEWGVSRNLNCVIDWLEFNSTFSTIRLQGWPKKVSHYQRILKLYLMVLKSANEIRFFRHIE